MLKLLDEWIIYPMSDSHWVSLVHLVPKKGGMTMFSNVNNKLIPTCKVMGWNVYIGYRKLNNINSKDHFSPSFIN